MGESACACEGVRAGAYVSPGLLLGAPVALLRYLAGSPIFAGALLALIAFTLGLEEISDPAAPAVEYAADLAFSGLETVVLLRVMLVGLIEERNFALARNIRAASMQVLRSLCSGTVDGLCGGTVDGCIAVVIAIAMQQSTAASRIDAVYGYSARHLPQACC